MANIFEWKFVLLFHVHRKLSPSHRIHRPLCFSFSLLFCARLLFMRGSVSWAALSSGVAAFCVTFACNIFATIHPLNWLSGDECSAQRDRIDGRRDRLRFVSFIVSSGGRKQVFRRIYLSIRPKDPQWSAHQPLIRLHCQLYLIIPSKVHSTIPR